MEVNFELQCLNLETLLLSKFRSERGILIFVEATTISFDAVEVLVLCRPGKWRIRKKVEYFLEVEWFPPHHNCLNPSLLSLFSPNDLYVLFLVRLTTWDW